MVALTSNEVKTFSGVVFAISFHCPCSVKIWSRSLCHWNTLWQNDSAFGTWGASAHWTLRHPLPLPFQWCAFWSCWRLKKWVLRYSTQDKSNGVWFNRINKIEATPFSHVNSVQRSEPKWPRRQYWILCTERTQSNSSRICDSQQNQFGCETRNNPEKTKTSLGTRQADACWQRSDAQEPLTETLHFLFVQWPLWIYLKRPTPQHADNHRQW